MQLWRQRCWLRNGWHMVKTRRGARLLFLYTVMKRTFAIDLTSRQGFGNEFALRSTDGFRLHILPLEDMKIDEALAVAEAFISAACAPASAAGAPAACRSL